METMYIIKDSKGRIASHLSFQREPMGRGRKPKWSYFSATDVVSGMTMYPNIDGNIRKVYDYLVDLNNKLGFNESFTIVSINPNNLKLDGKYVGGEITVGTGA